MKNIKKLSDFKHKKITLKFFDELQKLDVCKLNDLKLQAKQKAKKSF